MIDLYDLGGCHGCIRSENSKITQCREYDYKIQTI